MTGSWLATILCAQKISRCRLVLFPSMKFVFTVDTAGRKMPQDPIPQLLRQVGSADHSISALQLLQGHSRVLFFKLFLSLSALIRATCAPKGLVSLLCSHIGNRMRGRTHCCVPLL